MNTEILTLNADELLKRYTAAQLDDIAQRSAGVHVQSRLLIGRCLLAFQRGNLGWCAGVSGWLHYAIEVLGQSAHEARDQYHVARCLEELPLLTQAAQEGTIRWSHLLAVVGRATSDTEKTWLERARTCTIERLRKLLRGGDDPETPRDRELRLRVDPTLRAALEQISRELGEEAQRPLTFAEVVQCLCAERLTGTAFPDEKAWASATREAQRDAGLSPHAIRNAQLCFNEEARLLTPVQRRELLRRDGYRCRTPGCPNVLWLHAHHIQFYCEGGGTTPDNLVIVCSRCHRNVHEGHFHVSGRAPEWLAWTLPGGQCYERRGLLVSSGWFEKYWDRSRAPPLGPCRVVTPIECRRSA